MKKPDIIVARAAPVVRDEDGNPRLGAGGLVTTLQHAIRPPSDSEPGTVWNSTGVTADKPHLDEGGKEYVETPQGLLAIKRKHVPSAIYNPFKSGWSNAIWSWSHQSEQDLTWLPYYPVHQFKKRDLEAALQVNGLIAQSVAEELRPYHDIRSIEDPAIVWSQDFHLAFFANMLRPLLGEHNANTALIHHSHIPVAEYNATKKTTLNTPLQRRRAADYVSAYRGFDFVSMQSEEDVANFMGLLDNLGTELKGDEIKSLANHGYVVKGQSTHTIYQSHPISVNYDHIKSLAESDIELKTQVDGQNLEDKLDELYEKEVTTLGGLFRVDYTKGIIEGIKMVDAAMRHGHRLAFIGFFDMSRKDPEYITVRTMIQAEMDRVNEKYAQSDYKPITFGNYIPPEEGVVFLGEVDGVLVPSISDGQNLVVHEAIISQFVRAQEKNRKRPKKPGFVILGKNTGAARLLEPYITGQHGLAAVDPLDVYTRNGESQSVRTLIQMLNSPLNRIDLDPLRFLKRNDIHSFIELTLAAGIEAHYQAQAYFRSQR